ncbi:hypothetical protein DFH08DRAFT_818572 [Mycena albidolilacea]|uniref:Uncharacterized protein n=1 Tax=Mycena albidolilacea TaxID=1033008 RepID=A0AAD6ZGW9_9AGAR|nr:hypothetical protein DFH08DRAFT_818572 [Mycena albidolilacea]
MSVVRLQFEYRLSLPYTLLLGLLSSSESLLQNWAPGVEKGAAHELKPSPFISSIQVQYSVRIPILPSTFQPLRLAYTHFIPQAYLGPPSDPDREPRLARFNATITPPEIAEQNRLQDQHIRSQLLNRQNYSAALRNSASNDIQSAYNIRQAAHIAGVMSTTTTMHTQSGVALTNPSRNPADPECEKLWSLKRLQIQNPRVFVPAQAAPTLSTMSKGFQFKIQLRLEVELVEMVEVEMAEMAEEVTVEVEVDLPVEVDFGALLGVRIPLIQIGHLRTSCVQCPRLLAKASEML